MANARTSSKRGIRRSGPRARRLHQELKDIQDEEYENFSVSILDDNIQEWYCLVNGPPDSPYEDGIWKLKIIIGQKWPHRAPRVELQTPLLHVNYQESRNRLILPVYDHWDTTYHLVQIPLDFYDLLKEPHEKVVNIELNDLRGKNEQEYLSEVRKHTNTYAKKTTTTFTKLLTTPALNESLHQHLQSKNINYVLCMIDIDELSIISETFGQKGNVSKKKRNCKSN